MSDRFVTVLAAGAFAGVLAVGALAQRPSDTTAIEWPNYGNSKGGNRFSSAAQITPTNVGDLEVAWTYRTGPVAGPPGKSQSTPIFVDSRLFVTNPLGRVVALDPETGKELWSFDPRVDPDANYPDRTNRGVAFWRDPAPALNACATRIFVTPVDARLIALDAATGELCVAFGINGEVSLLDDLVNPPLYKGEYAQTSPPTIIRDLVIVGSGIADNQRLLAPSGVVRAFDARTGRLRWSWDPVPRDSTQPGYDSWGSDEAHRSGAANVWSIGSVDEQLDLVFLPTGSASVDFYGGTRPGNNLYSTSLVALRGSTGALVWHFQPVHHDIFDYDVPAQPALFTFKRGMDEVPAVLQATKMGHLFVLDRRTGIPLLPIEERAVPKSTIATESASPTQPFPVRPPPIVPQHLTAADAWGASEADRNWCRERMRGLRADGIFTPPSLQGSIIFPGNLGGAHWGGAAINDGGVAVIPTNRLANVITLIPRSDFAASSTARPGVTLGSQTGTPYGVRKERLITQQGTPCNPPPFGALVAVDVNAGVIKWEVPLGFLPWLKGYPEARSWGSHGVGGAIVTGTGLAFVAATLDAHMRAFDVATGRQVWEHALPTPALATPMTYQTAAGRQFVVISAGGHNSFNTVIGDYVVAFALSRTRLAPPRPPR